MAAGDLTTLANALAWLGLTSDTNGSISRLISAVSTEIQNFLSYQIASQNYTRTFNGRGGDRLMVPDVPMTAVSAVAIDGVSIAASTGPTVSGFVFNDTTIFLRGYCFNRGVQNITASYTAGYLTTPTDIEQACLDWLKTVYDRYSMQRASNVTMQKAGGVEMRWGEDTAMAGRRLLAPMPVAVYALLQPYSRVFPA